MCNAFGCLEYILANRIYIGDIYVLDNPDIMCGAKLLSWYM